MSNQLTLDKIMKLYNSQEDERLGQFFINRFISCQWPELFYCEDLGKCSKLIQCWLEDNQYVFDMPPYVLQEGLR